MTDQEKQESKAELKALLAELTASDAMGASIGTQIDELEQGAIALEDTLGAAQADIDTIVEESGKEIDALVAAEQAEA